MLYYQLYFIDRGEMKLMKDLEIMAENTRSLQLFLNLHILNIDNKDAYMAASHMGRAAGLCHILTQMPYFLQKQIHIVPQELLDKHHTSHKYLWEQRHHGKLSEELLDIVLE